MADTYGSSYTTSSPGRPYTPPHSIYPAALMSLSTGEMSSDSTSGHTSCGSGSHLPNLSSGHTSCGSGSHLPNLSSGPHSVRYNPIVSSVARSTCEVRANVSNTEAGSAFAASMIPSRTSFPTQNSRQSCVDLLSLGPHSDTPQSDTLNYSLIFIQLLSDFVLHSIYL